MFEKNGMRMSKEHILEFFRVLDADKSGGLSIGEFKEFLFSEKCRDSNLFLIMCRVSNIDEEGEGGTAKNSSGIDK